MNPRNVYAVLAAGLNHPDMILRWQADPEFLRRSGLDPNLIDLGALWKFSGLAVKVRHNGLRPEFPLSFRLMKAAGLDINLFSSYATACSAKNHRYASGSLQRARDLIDFVEEWRDPNQTLHSLLWDMMRHEQALLELKAASLPASSDQMTPILSSNLPGSGVLQVRGSLILHEMRHNPGDIESALLRRPIVLDQIPIDIHYYGYWRSSGTEKIQILDLDAFAFYTLGLSDGTITLSQMSVRFGGSNRLTQAFKRAIGHLAESGILEIHDSSPARST